MRIIRNFKGQIKGLPVTAQRRLLLGLILHAGGHISAKELYRRAIDKNESISLATVYRTLRLFKDLDLIEERRLGQVNYYYEIKGQPEHHHLVCRCCGNVIEFNSNLIRKIIEKVQRDYGFNVTKTELYIEGYCQQCMEETSARAGAGKLAEMFMERIDTKKAKIIISENTKIQKAQSTKKTGGWNQVNR